ncbi:MAG: osmoprotectant NAGGN system M42 family peptidase [Propionibacterium sp.]|nr:osmoprotectant NAGGN system M42 family peptidase [Propionibacterium sp.]
MKSETRLELDEQWLLDTLLSLLQTPSPSGRTDAVMHLIGETMSELGLPFWLTRRGALIAELPGRSETMERAIVVHADTIGCMVRELKDNGRLSVIPIGTFSARFAAGARVRIFRDGTEQHLTGTIMPLKASGHAFGDDVDTQPTDWDHVEVRVDERAHSKADLEALGLQIGDSVALIASPELTDAGFIVSRHLDGKAGVAIALALAKSVVDAGIELPHRTGIMVTITEEVGHGATGLPADVAEMISLDNSVCAPGQHSIEHGVTIPMADLHGPFDYHLTRRLCALAEQHDITHARDVFRYYRSDVAAAIEAGAETRAALVAFGVDGSHGWERTEFASLTATYELVARWLQTSLTFADWDTADSRDLADFPAEHQPAQTEQWVPLTRGDFTDPGETDPAGAWPPPEGPH